MNRWLFLLVIPFALCCSLPEESTAVAHPPAPPAGPSAPSGDSDEAAKKAWADKAQANLKAREAAAAPADTEPRVVAEGRSAATFDGAVDAALPAVTTHEELVAHDGQRVRLLGVYGRHDMRRAAVPPPTFRGHVRLELADGSGVMLFPVWRDEARRPLGEVDALQGQPVVVVGTVHARAPEPPDQSAAPIGPCVDAVEVIAAQ